MDDRPKSNFITIIEATVALALIQAQLNALIPRVQAFEEPKRELVLPEAAVRDLAQFYAKEHGSDAKVLVEVMRCESGFKPEVVGDHGNAYGIGQFWPRTFDMFKNEAGLPELEYKRPLDQINLMAWAFANGKERHWTCFGKIKKSPR